MAVADPTVRALEHTRQAFDSVAHAYADANANNQILRRMRSRVMAAVTDHARAGARVLDLGCGPGQDATALALAGHPVTAIDWSPAMVDETRRRVRQEGLLGEVDVRQMGIHEVDRLAPASFDVALSNFGPLNCVPDLAESARLIADRLVRGGTLVASVIGRVCPWELALYSVRGNPARARLRFSRSSVPVPLNGEIVWTRYYGVREFTRAFRAAGLTRVDLRALGVFVPPPYMDAFAARHPRLIAGAERLDDAVGRWPGVRACGDHFLIVMVKR